MNKFFSEVNKNFGFGCMRLPMSGDEVDIEQFKVMVDKFIDAGFNYFDTAHGYISGKSEKALKVALTSRYPREKYLLINKLTETYFKKQEDIIPFLNEQLEICGVEYFDFYLMHAQNRKNINHFRDCKAYETCLKAKEEGKIRHLGLSFHDSAEVLDNILTEYPFVEFVQLQFNYLDYENPNVESRKCYEVCVKHNKPVMVMEPVKGGSLVKLPNDASIIFDELQKKRNEKLSYASYAIRFAANFDNIAVVLSGMSNIEQMDDNLSFMKNYKKLDEEEMKAIEEVRNVFMSKGIIPCTGCRYCVDGCPKKIAIPDLFQAMNKKKVYNDWNQDVYYKTRLTLDKGKASDCIKCGKCEHICPQNLNIRELLVKVAEEFEK